VDLSALPTRTVLRWDLAVRIGLAILGPLLVQAWLTAEVLGTALITGLAAALISLSSLGPESAGCRLSLIPTTAAPVAEVAAEIAAWLANGDADSAWRAFIGANDDLAVRQRMASMGVLPAASLRR
jgi:hypothetical protein